MKKKKKLARKIPLSEISQELFKEKTNRKVIEEPNSSIETLKSINSNLIETRGIM